MEHGRPAHGNESGHIYLEPLQTQFYSYNLKHSLNAEKSFLNRQRKGEMKSAIHSAVNEGCAAKPN